MTTWAMALIAGLLTPQVASPKPQAASPKPQAPSPKPQPGPTTAETVSAAALRALVADLSDRRWSVRNRATEELFYLGRVSFDALRAEFRRTPSYEVKRRIRYLVEMIEFYRATMGRGGFLGIRHQQRRHAQHEQIPKGHVWYEIDEVVKGTAAARAGLRAGDYITAVNGRPLKADDQPDFTTWIGLQPSGTKVRLGVIRGGESVAFDVVLGRRPLKYLANRANPAQAQRAQQMRAARNAFPVIWRRDFDPTGAVDETESMQNDPAWTLESTSQVTR